MNNLNLVRTEIHIAGQKIHFAKLDLQQKFFQHHYCRILVDHDAFGDKKWMIDPVKIFKLIGESLSITMQHEQTGETNVFIGIVSDISFVGNNGAQNHILIEGSSESIKFNGKSTMDSFSDKTLDVIAKETIANSGNGASLTIQPEYKKTLEFIYQYKESAWDFLLRLCSLYGESLWNDGTQTYFGKPDLDHTVVLEYEKEVTNYNLKGSLLAPKLRNYEYLKFYDEEYEKETRKSVPEATGYLQPILDKADSIYTSDAVTPLDANVNDSDSILQMVDIERTRTVANMLVMSGKTQTCKIGIGKVVRVDFPKYMEITTTAGDFIITEINHTVDQEGHYSNTFSGVRAALGYIPMPPVSMPIAASERATVLSNADPENKGRIQVQFAWQKEKGKQTNWIRVQTPDAGGSDKVASNRGLVTIPENGDTVMINFEYGDPNRPYSSGSLFTSKNGGGGGQGNKTKSLTTRSGSTLTLNDEDGSVMIKDKSGSESKITLDGEKNIIIESDILVSIKVGNDKSLLQMNNEGEIKIGSIKSIEFTVGGSLIEMTPDNISISGEKIDILGSQNTIKGNSTINGGDVIIN